MTQKKDSGDHRSLRTRFLDRFNGSHCTKCRLHAIGVGLDLLAGRDRDFSEPDYMSITMSSNEDCCEAIAEQLSQLLDAKQAEQRKVA
jgi:hypothetical protein